MEAESASHLSELVMLLTGPVSGLAICVSILASIYKFVIKHGIPLARTGLEIHAKGMRDQNTALKDMVTGHQKNLEVLISEMREDRKDFRAGLDAIDRRLSYIEGALGDRGGRS
tara:strand:+ start:398 stop:739 length:342 start_codon:yes stop_codon:yes gene_type:complete